MQCHIIVTSISCSVFLLFGLYVNKQKKNQKKEKKKSKDKYSLVSFFGKEFANIRIHNEFRLLF